MGEGLYKARRPAEVFMLIAFCQMLAVNVYTMNRFIITTIDQFLFYFKYAWIIICFIIVCILIYRAFTNKRIIQIQIKPDSILLNENIIEANNIKVLFIKGYFKPVIGIKPRSNIFVPYKLCFCFLEKEDQGIKELIAWAEQNQIKVAHKRFSRWI